MPKSLVTINGIRSYKSACGFSWNWVVHRRSAAARPIHARTWSRCGVSCGRFFSTRCCHRPTMPQSGRCGAALSSASCLAAHDPNGGWTLLNASSPWCRPGRCSHAWRTTSSPTLCKAGAATGGLSALSLNIATFVTPAFESGRVVDRSVVW